MKLLLAIPSPEQVDAEFSLKNLPEIIYYAKQRYPNLSIKVLHKTGT